MGLMDTHNPGFHVMAFGVKHPGLLIIYRLDDPVSPQQRYGRGKALKPSSCFSIVLKFLFRCWSWDLIPFRIIFLRDFYFVHPLDKPSLPFHGMSLTISPDGFMHGAHLLFLGRFPVTY
ncbi:hypothetical protein EL17_23790 [Anditalea andensis]|uniref:Uncharacterized protein n=1 Tax=Anditalea andensis TaxID=1048983 RepID=A0A074LP25_9BACT|nr:hypothetical protein EL17_23790 [Anditalea andensis]